MMTFDEKITFIIPTRNNLQYLKLAYESIKKYANNHNILILNDGSTDSTNRWLDSLNDENLKYINYEPKNEPIGHTVLYNIGFTLSTTRISSILHADMIIGPNYVENILKHLKPKSIVSATRIEPPIHPKETLVKITKNFGMYENEFVFDEFEKEIIEIQSRTKNKTTRGIFAPWAMYNEDYIYIGGQDPLFSPYPYEDSDFFLRLNLASFEIIQSWDALVYHFTCRGHKWTEKIGENHSQFSGFEKRARKNYFRKWHKWIKNDEYGCPIAHHIYDIAIIAKNATIDFIRYLEPFCSNLYVEYKGSIDIIKIYIEQEQKKTLIDLSKKIFYINNENEINDIKNEIIITFDASAQHPEMNSILNNLNYYIESSNDAGQYKIGNCLIIIKNKNYFENTNIRKYIYEFDSNPYIQ